MGQKGELTPFFNYYLVVYRGDIMELYNSVSEILNVGNHRERILNNMNIYTIKDLIEYFPRGYEDRSNIRKISDLVVGEFNTFIGSVARSAENTTAKRLIITNVKIKDETGKVNVVWFNQPYMKDVLKSGCKYIFTGKYKKDFNKSEVVSPEYEKVTDENNCLSGGRITPVYVLTFGISQKILRSIIKDTLDKTYMKFYDFIPFEIRKKYHLCERGFAITNIHFPQNNESFFIARHRLVFEEFFMMQLALLKMKVTLKTNKKGIALKNDYSDIIIKNIPFSLTNAQKKVFDEVKKDMFSNKPMNRLIQGDVGSGKTIVAVMAAFINIKNGFQSVLMVPTEVLATQHFEVFNKIFSSLGIKTVLITGSLTKKKKQETTKEILNGDAQMVIGTHAVIQDDIKFKNLSLVITDEQHRFGVRQRSILSEKGNNPHILVMTATPIPRTLALILYGDLDISIIDELPPGRQKIDTRAVTSSYHERVYNFIKKEIDKGHQAYIICPMIDENEKLDIQAAITYTNTIKEETFFNYKVECLHGRMKPKEKQIIMDKFVSGEIDILVSTTVIEVGINVPNATIMLIENAERFGLAQLHQLRGRVGRGSEQSYCILICDSKNNIAKQRMKVMKNSCDGFEISEMDLKLRGPGEFFGTRQHGLPELKIANIYKDMPILKEAQEAANEVINDKKNKILSKEEDEILSKEIINIIKPESISI